MKYYSIPADFKQSTIDDYALLNQQYEGSTVIETYGNITIDNLMESGRAASSLPPIDLLDLYEYIQYSASKGIEFNYTINSPHLGNKEFTDQGIQDIKRFVTTLYDVGVRSLTIALPSLYELVRSLNLPIKIKASTLCQINCANKAVAYKKMGMERIVVDESINRSFHHLRNIVKCVGNEVEVIVNPICHQNCIYRMFHYNQIGGDSVGESNSTGVNYYEHRCVMQRFEELGNLLRMSWIRPEDVHYYESIGIHYFKLQGRHTFAKGGDPVKTATCYFEENFDGNLMDLLTMFAPLNHFQVHVDNKKLDNFLKPFIKSDSFCNHDCTSCNYCEMVARKTVDVEKSLQVTTLAKQFYREFDAFNQKIKEEEGTGTERTAQMQEELVGFHFDND